MSISENNNQRKEVAKDPAACNAGGRIAVT
jgi:hypothetical protein